MNHSVNHNKKFHQFFGALIRFYQFSMLDCTRLHISSVHRHRKTGHTLWLHTRMSLKPGKRVWWWKGDIWALRLTVCPPPSHLWPKNSKPCRRKLIPALSSCVQRDERTVWSPGLCRGAHKSVIGQDAVFHLLSIWISGIPQPSQTFHPGWYHHARPLRNINMSIVTALGTWKNMCGATGEIEEVEFETFPKTLTIADPFREAGSLGGG